MSEYIDNQTQREEKLKAIILQLHEGKSVEEVEAAFAELLEDVGPDEIVRIEEALVTEGLDPAEIQPLCDVHVAVFRESLDKQKAPETMPGHPIFTYRAENLGVRQDVAEFWIQMGAPEENGMFVHIRCYPLRDEDGTYRGTIEVTQNLAPLRKLEGEKRLLDE